MAKKKATSKETRKGFPSKKLLLISISLALLIILSAVIYHVFWGSQNNVEFPLRAVIVDQVGADIPSSPEEVQRFNETVFNLLKNASFEVRYYESKSVTVNLYRRLAKENYGVIILRVHSAIRERETLVDFFTSEEYRQNVYSNELNSGLLTRGNYSWLPNKYYFAITPKFVMEAVEGSFPGSIIIAMGCSSLKLEYEEMADAFIQKGAKVYIGWTDAVSIIHSDNSTIRFLQQFLEYGKTIREAINECNKFKDPQWPNAVLFYRVKENKIANYRFSDFTAKMVLGVLFTSSRGKRLS
ncbi:MAG: hypothetical protein QXZ51_06350 [Candidatus Bathyarchaeia archaeon]